MDKPRIVIVDDDFSYVMPLQSRFIYEFFDDLDIEVITDRSYYEQLFGTMQKIDVLIVDRQFYNSELHKHAINHIFVMTEDMEDEGEYREGVNVLYKYTNTKEIFLSIIGKSALKPMSKSIAGPKIILVTSASGGTGKTTIALGIATALSDMYKKVLYIEASRLQSFQYYMDYKGPIEGQEIYTGMMNADRNIYNIVKTEIRTEKFSYMPQIKSTIMAFGIDYSMFGKVAKAARESGEYDYIIIDADNTFDDAKAKMMSVSDRIVVVTEQNARAAYATELFACNTSNSASDKYVYICNKYEKEKENMYSSGTDYSYIIDEYVEKLDQYENMSYIDYGRRESIRKIAFLLI